MTDRIENNVSNNSSIVVCVFIAAVTFLLSHCLATIREHTYRHRDCTPLKWLRCHNIYMKSHNDWFRHSKVGEGGYTDSMVISTSIFFFFSK
jgi:hypothetical protein